MDKFSVGEVAILQNCGLLSNNGLEVTVDSGLILISGTNPDGSKSSGFGYLVSGLQMVNAAMAHQLRKRPPDADEEAAWTAALDCIDKAKRSAGVPA